MNNKMRTKIKILVVVAERIFTVIYKFHEKYFHLLVTCFTEVRNLGHRQILKTCSVNIPDNITLELRNHDIF